MLKRNKITVLRAAISGMLAFFLAGNANASPLDTPIKIEKEVAAASSKSQKKIDRFAEQTVDMSADYKNALRVIEQLKDYNRQLEVLIESQEEEMQSIQKQMDTIDTTERGVVPLMNEMLATLEKFITLDMPFDREKRLGRVNRLKNAMLRADFSNSEKYRGILEAYQAEILYGSEMKTYQGPIELDGVETIVDFLRFGRILIVYRSLDGQNAGYFDTASGTYKPLDEEYLRSIELGIKMANKQAAFELIKLPVPAAQGAN